jgi:gas vesicle protein
VKTHFVIAQVQPAQQTANISLPWYAAPLLGAVVGAILALSIQKYMAKYNHHLTLQKEKTNQSVEDRKKVVEMETNSPVLAAIAALDTKLTGEIKSLDQKLTGEIKSLDQKLTGEIKALDSKFTKKFDDVNLEIQNLTRQQDLTNQNLFHLVETLNLDREKPISFLQHK